MEEIKESERRQNGRPRKTLGFKTPQKNYFIC